MLVICGTPAIAGKADPQLPQQSIDDRTARSLSWMKGREICDKARKDASLDNAQRLKICENILKQAFEREKAEATRPRDGFERNFFWLGVAGIRTSLMGLTGEIDKVRSKRSCEYAVGADAARSKIDRSQWPDKYLAYLEQDATAKALLTACRAEFPGLVG